MSVLAPIKESKQTSEYVRSEDKPEETTPAEPAKPEGESK